MNTATPHKLPPRYRPKVFLEMLRDPVGFLSHAPENYPVITRFRVLHHKVYVINHPELAQYVLQENFRNFPKGQAYEVLAILLGNGLINSEGDFWKRQRRLAQPAFHRDSLQRISNIVTTTTSKLLERWKKQEGATINFTQEMAGLTIEIVARALFTADVTPQDINTVWKNVNYLNDQAIRMIRNPIALPFWMPLPSYLKAKKSVETLDNLVFGIIAKRKNGGDFSPDLLQLLLEARDEDTGEGMTDKQLKDEVMTIFLAGHETTVNALSWTWYLLGQHPAELEKLKSESVRFADKPPVFEDLPFMNYGKHIMNESMRLYPPVYAIGRQLIKPDTIGGYHTPQETRILINISGLHHHPDYWENPWLFNPSRFENFEMKGENRFLFMPFGGGPRICIGNNFAMMEMQMINAMLSQHVELELLSKDIKPLPQITLKPGDGVMMKIKKVKLPA